MDKKALSIILVGVFLISAGCIGNTGTDNTSVSPTVTGTPTPAPAMSPTPVADNGIDSILDQDLPMIDPE